MKIYEMTFGDSGKKDIFPFFSPTTIYNITKFQRPYTWDEYQIKGVFQDIEYALSTDKIIGWPSMLVQEKETADALNKEYDLGDGQQRSTTIFLFLMAIWHKWKISYRETGEAKEHQYFDSIFHIGDSRNLGILARKNYGEIKTSIKFQIPRATEKVHNLFNTEIMTDETIKNMMNSIDEKDDSYKIYENFVFIWRELRKADYSEEILKKISKILLTKIVFPVVIYSKDEDMFRAFANTNSFGEPLTQSELVKAEFYGRVKKVDSELADKIADYWNHVMDPWFAKNKTDLVDFDWFLIQEFNIFDNWSWIIKNQASGNKLKRLQRSRWLNTEWQKYFNRVSDELNNDPYELKEFYSETFKKLKEHFKIVKIIFEKTETKPLSKEWEMQYTYNVFSSIYMGIIFQLHDKMNEKDFIEALKILRKYYFYNSIVLKDKNPHQLLIQRDSPLKTKKQNLSFEDFEQYLITKKSNKGEWYDYDETCHHLSRREYENSFNSVFSKLFVYINNEKLVENNHEKEQKNTIFLGDISREHIAPQKNRNMINVGIEKEEFYKQKISMIGNILIITGKENSALKNSPVKDKVKIYKDSQGTPWGNFWINDFLEDYYKAPEKWDKIEEIYKSIDARSKKLAKIIAKYISVPKSGKVEIGNPSQPFRMLTIKDDKGNFSSDKNITSVFISYLTQIIKDPVVRKIIIDNSNVKSAFYYPENDEIELKNIILIDKDIFLKKKSLSKDGMMNIINELNGYLLNFNIQLIVEYIDEDLNPILI